METGGGMFSRISERVIAWILFGLLVLIGFAIWRMPGDTRDAIVGGILRTAAWVIIAAVTPWTTWFIIRRVAEAGTNWAGTGLLVGLTGANLVAAWALMTGWPSGGWAWFAGFAALGVSATYNYLVTEYLAQQSGA